MRYLVCRIQRLLAFFFVGSNSNQEHAHPRTSLIISVGAISVSDMDGILFRCWSRFFG